MKNEQLDELVSQVPGLKAAAWSDDGGAVQAFSDGFDADVPCAVAAICQGQLNELGSLLSAGAVKDWAVVTKHMNLYVIDEGRDVLVAVGDRDDKPTKTTEMLALALSD